MKLITVFSTPKPFTDPHIDTIQRNAIQSWMHLGDQAEIFLVGDEPGQSKVANAFGIRVLPDVERNQEGTPLVSSIFDLARRASNSPYLVYVNADILLLDDLTQTIGQMADTLGDRPFLLIGQRWDLDVTELLDFSTGWQLRLREDIEQLGHLHPPAGSDYFVFPRQAFMEIPDFAIGRAGWDNWMIYHALQKGWPVIDGTPSIMIVHQNHDYRHLPEGKPHYDQAESQQNMSMAGGLANMYMLLDTNHQWIDGRLRPAPITPARTVRSLERIVMPKDGNLRNLRGTITRRLRRLRRKLTQSE